MNIDISVSYQNMLDNVADDCSQNLSKKLIKIRCETGRLIGTDNELNVFKKNLAYQENDSRLEIRN